MIEANRRLFKKLADAGGERIPTELRQQKRAIRTGADEKIWLRKLTLRTSGNLLLGGAAKLAIGELDDVLYLIAIGVNVSEAPSEFERVEANAGIFTAVASELDVPVLRTSNVSERLLEYVFYPVEETIELLDVDVIRPFFQQIEVYRIDRGGALGLDDQFELRVATAAILCAPGARALAWTPASLERIHYMVRDPAERAPFHLLLRALTETREDAAFLAMYRCIEQLFPVPAIAELSDELKLSGSALAIASTIERHLGWRRREDDAIAHLFEELDPSLVDRMVDVVGVTTTDQNRSRPVSRRVYELRNQCVHYRPVHALDGAVRLENWLPIVDLMLEVVQKLYARHAKAFDSQLRESIA